MQFLEDITLSQVWGWIMAAFVAVVSIDKGIDVFRKWHKASPDGQQSEKLKALDARVSTIETQVIRYGELFRNDKERLDAMDKSNYVIQEALFALLSHAIDGNDVEECKKVKKSLEAYLIHK